MEDESTSEIIESESRTPDVTYNPDKDFYRGMGGELRFKAEGLFKKAKEKGISIEDIDIAALKETRVDFPGIGAMDLPAYMVKVRGRHIQSGQVIADGKQIDYYNRYQGYMADRIEGKNLVRDERGRIVRENNKPKVKNDIDLVLNDWELFQIGKSLVDDKEFGLEKTITGACDRVIRKLMGENDWLYPDEARLLDEEFNNVQEKISAENEERKESRQDAYKGPKKATERQVSYLKARIKNSGMDPDNADVMREFLRQAGFDTSDAGELTTAEMSRVIDAFGSIFPKVREALKKSEYKQ